MFKRIVLFMAVLSLSFGITAPAMADEDGNGVIEGQLINRTEGGSSVADQDIELTTYRNDSETDSSSISTDEEGKFIIDGLSTDREYSYELTVNYQEADYQSDRLYFLGGENSLPVEIEVYDSTTSPDAIKIQQAHTVVYTDQETLWVEEFFLFINESDRTYIGMEGTLGPGVRQTLQFSLPENALEMQPAGELMECCVYGTETGFVDSMPFFPGGKEISYAYKIEYGPKVHTFAWKVNYPIAKYDLLVQGMDSVISSDWLTPDQPMDISGVLFNHVYGDDFTLGDTVVFEISGLPEVDNQNIILWVVLAVVALGFGFGFVLFRRNKKVQPVRVESNLEQQKQKLLVEIARLDDTFESGSMSQKAYKRMRAEKKAQLLSLMQRAKGKSGKR